VAAVPRLGIVLAAGRSERLRPVTGGGSKALLRVGGVPLVERAVRGLLRAGVEEVVVVVGYQAGPVAAVVKRIAPGRVRAVYAREWEQGNGASLAAAERVVTSHDDVFVLVTMDHLFGDGTLEQLIRTSAPAVLVDRSPQEDVWAEGTRVRIRRGAAYAFSKELEEQSVDCGAFLLPRDVFACLREAAVDGDYSLATALTLLARKRPLRAVSVSRDGWWQDVDTPQDLRIAKHRLRRSLMKKSDGPVSHYLNRPLSTRLSMLVAPLGISADLLSLMSAGLGAFGAWLLADGSAIGGALAVHGSSVLDGVDGEVARLRLKASAYGALLDGVLDRLVDAAVIAGLGIWALRAGTSPTSVILLVGAATAAAILSMASKDRISSLGLLPAAERAMGWLLGGRDGRLMLVAVFSALGLPGSALIAITIASGLTLFLRVASVLRRER
jgi:1L-myo-inositol 1-phosphate cytidylyltransferase / CDP-L-myo-inositol myo-inositolphosphotransferase